MIDKMLIYDRWGEQIFQAQNFASNDPMQGWDGHFRGTMLQPGVYTYVIMLEEGYNDKYSTLSGDVTIIR
jgi:gliding motility-associated-like protein